MKTIHIHVGRFRIQGWQQIVVVHALIGCVWIVFSDILAVYFGIPQRVMSGNSRNPV